MASKRKIYIISIIFALAALLLVMFFIWPMLVEIEIYSKQLLSEKNDIGTLEAQAAEIENFKKKYDVYGPDLEKMKQRFIDPDNPADFIKFLEKTASDSEIASEISFLPSLPEKNQTFVTFQFFSKEDFPKILKFLEKLEAGPYLIEIKNLTIKGSAGQSEKVNANFLIKVLTRPR